MGPDDRPFTIQRSPQLRAEPRRVLQAAAYRDQQRRRPPTQRLADERRTVMSRGVPEIHNGGTSRRFRHPTKPTTHSQVPGAPRQPPSKPAKRRQINTGEGNLRQYQGLRSQARWLDRNPISGRPRPPPSYRRAQPRHTLICDEPVWREQSLRVLPLGGPVHATKFARTGSSTRAAAGIITNSTPPTAADSRTAGLVPRGSSPPLALRLQPGGGVSYGPQCAIGCPRRSKSTPTGRSRRPRPMSQANTCAATCRRLELVDLDGARTRCPHDSPPGVYRVLICAHPTMPPIHLKFA
jgi:hypothetical protein